MATLKDYLISGKFTGDISINGFNMSLKDMLISAKLSGGGGGGGALYPLTDGTYTSETGKVTVTISNGNHVRVDFSSSVGGNYFINLTEGLMGSAPADVINNRPQWFNIPSDVQCVLSFTNVTNVGLSWQSNFRLAGATTSGSFGTTQTTGSSDQIVTKTLSNTESVSCLFLYLSSMSEGDYLEFDVSFTCDGTQYI